MAGGRTSSWADAVAATLERLDVADTIEELRHHIDELIGRLAEADSEQTRRSDRPDAPGAIDDYIERLGHKVEAANDLLSEVADVLEAQGERIETIEQQLGDPDTAADAAAGSEARTRGGRPDADLVAAVGELSELLAARFDGLERRLSGLESRLDDVLAVVGERQRQIEELEERLLILVSAPPAATSREAESPPRWPGKLHAGDGESGPAAEDDLGGNERTVLSGVAEASETAGQAAMDARSKQEASADVRLAENDASVMSGPKVSVGGSAGGRPPQGATWTPAVGASGSGVEPLNRMTRDAAGGQGVAERGNGGSDARIEQLVEKAVSATREFAPGAVLETAKPEWRKAHPTVLVVDDVPDARMILSVYLSKTGYQVVTAASAEDCLAKLLHHDVDAIVLDVRMPGADGRHVCRVLAEDPAYVGKRGTPIIVYTGYPEEYGREEVLAWGASDYVVKGGDMLPLITALVRHTQPFAEQRA